jgi:hypothetical protein
MTLTLPAGKPLRRAVPRAGDLALRPHLGSHRARVSSVPLAGTCTTGPEPGDRSTSLDAVLVPAFRSARRLHAAADVAATADCALVLLCSGGVRADAATAEVDRRYPPSARPARLTVLAVDVAHGHARAGDCPALRTTQAPAVAHRRSHDAHLKRNLGILLARLLGWRRILFHNDDVDGFTSADLARTLALLDDPLHRWTASGWAYRDFPDNSVVCHAHREAGGEQDTFISDATLAVTVSGQLPFFPAVYNEDWLFLHPLLQRGEVVLAGDWLRQAPYDPFADPSRPVAEEFGDLLGEGLLRLEHLGEPVETALDADFWRPELAYRVWFITDVARRLPDGPRHDLIRARLRAALAEHEPDWPEQLAGYVRAWREDLLRWEKHLSGLPQDLELGAALARLGLAEDTVISYPR